MVLTVGLDIQYGRQLDSFETMDSRKVIVKFKDDSSAKERLLIAVLLALD